jgi:hypothetical protein
LSEVIFERSKDVNNEDECRITIEYFMQQFTAKLCHNSNTLDASTSTRSTALAAKGYGIFSNVSFICVVYCKRSSIYRQSRNLLAVRKSKKHLVLFVRVRRTFIFGLDKFLIQKVIFYRSEDAIEPKLSFLPHFIEAAARLANHISDVTHFLIFIPMSILGYV